MGLKGEGARSWRTTKFLVICLAFCCRLVLWEGLIWCLRRLFYPAIAGAYALAECK